MSFDKKISQVYITLYQEGNRPIRWGSRRETLQDSIIRVIEKLKLNARYKDFDVRSSDRCRVMFGICICSYYSI